MRTLAYVLAALAGLTVGVIAGFIVQTLQNAL